MNRKSTIYPYNKTLLGNKKEQGTETCYNTDELQKLYGKQKKPDKKIIIA